VTEPAIRYIEIDAEERERETALRDHFAQFWATSTGEPRTIYDRFVEATPVADGVTLEAVAADDVRGWWVRPSGAKPGCAMLFIHGGGYVMGSAKAYRGFASQLVARTGVPALVLEYPLAPEAALPAGPEAAVAAYRWLARQGHDQIAIVGDSAGGGLSLVTHATLSRAEEPFLAQHADLQDGGPPRQGRPGAARQLLPRPLGAAVFSPWTDLAFTGASMHDPAVVDPLIGYDYLRDCARALLRGADPSDPLASPLHGDLHGLAPVFIQVGTDERLLDDSRGYAARAARAGVDVQLEVWQGMHHVFQLDVARLASSRRALDHAAGWLASLYRRTAGAGEPGPGLPAS
jgi:acetyl esterase/lipase